LFIGAKTPQFQISATNGNARFFHPHNLLETLIIYAAIAVLAGIVCVGIALYQERQKQKFKRSKFKNADRTY